MRVLALDYGAASCGCAVSDPSGTIATPIDPVENPGTRAGLRRVSALAQETGAEVVLVGLPVSLGGGDSAQTEEVREFARRLQERVGDGVQVRLYDERFTTKLAEAAGGDASEDSRAAAILLEEWLDANPPAPEGETR
ncbi:MAG: Holliday junction resolvase RuvX [Solirubrobacterales bacterium]